MTRTKDAQLTATVCLVTGASRGLGRALAGELLNDSKTTVIAVARTTTPPPDCSGTAARWLPITADLADPAQVERLISRVHDTVGVPSLLINAAASGVYAPLLATDPIVTARLIALNFLAAARLCQAFIPAMVTRGGGTVINISTLAACGPIHQLGVYGVSKAALDAYTVTLRAELAGTGVRVLLARPGRMATGFFAAAGYPPELVVAARRFVRPETVAAQILAAARRGGEFVVPPDQWLLRAQRWLPRRLAERLWYRGTHPASEGGV